MSDEGLSAYIKKLSNHWFLGLVAASICGAVVGHMLDHWALFQCPYVDGFLCDLLNAIVFGAEVIIACALVVGMIAFLWLLKNRIGDRIVARIARLSKLWANILGIIMVLLLLLLIIISYFTQKRTP
jgi:Na+/phosphate symporter